MPIGVLLPSKVPITILTPKPLFLPARCAALTDVRHLEFMEWLELGDVSGERCGGVCGESCGEHDRAKLTRILKL